jgi:hypothetical protein
MTDGKGNSNKSKQGIWYNSQAEFGVNCNAASFYPILFMSIFLIIS